MKKLLIALSTVTLMSTSAIASDNNYSFSSSHCSVNVNYGVVIDPNSIRFVEDSQTHVQINNNEQLFVNGKQVNLDAKQQALVSEYSEQLNAQVPGVVKLASDAVDIAFNAIRHVVAGFSGEDSGNSERLEEIFTRINDKVEKRFGEKDGSFYLAQQNFDEFDRFMEDELEQEIEAIVKDSVGDILIALGSAINNEDGDFEQKMEAFGTRMETMGEEVEAAVEDKAQELEKQADVLCANLKDIDQIEYQLQNSISALSDFNLITVGD